VTGQVFLGFFIRRYAPIVIFEAQNMFRAVSSVGHPIRFKDELASLSGLFDRHARERFSTLLSRGTGFEYVHLTGSGAAAFLSFEGALQGIGPHGRPFAGVHRIEPGRGGPPGGPEARAMRHIFKRFQRSL